MAESPTGGQARSRLEAGTPGSLDWPPVQMAFMGREITSGPAVALGFLLLTAEPNPTPCKGGVASSGGESTTQKEERQINGQGGEFRRNFTGQRELRRAQDLTEREC